MAYFTLKFSTALITLLAGILILAFPKALRIMVGVYFVIVGILGLLGGV